MSALTVIGICWSAVLLIPVLAGLAATRRRIVRFGSRALFCSLTGSLVVGAQALGADDPSAAFDAANKLYEQGRFAEAAAAYEKLLESGPRTETVWFNLGDARFKAGQLGRAIAAYRQAERFAPRDPAIRFNLQFARKKATGTESIPGPAWQRAVAALTLNEWTALAVAGGWLWFGLLALREARPALRPALRGYTGTAGAVAALLVACTAAAANLRFNTRAAVVTVPEVIVRSGPFEEARTLHQFRDGVELSVLDQKDVTVADQRQTWLQVRDGANRTGWLKSDQVARLSAEEGVNPQK
jgi:tetratricopeptide (TPR) repeat protein